MIPTPDRMPICEVCEADPNCGFGVTLDGLRMGDAGRWFCSEHRPDIKQNYTREEWAAARAAGKLYPDEQIVSHETEAAE